MTDGEILRPAEAARRLGVPAKVVVQAMHERKLPRLRLADRTLGIPADALADFQRPESGPEEPALTCTFGGR